MAILTTHALKKHYGRIIAVDGVDMETVDGELLAVLGPSGSGKTTLMRLVAGLEEPSSGKLYIDGHPIMGVPPRKRNIAMVFQSYALYPNMTVRDNILFPLRARKIASDEQKRQLEWVTEILEIADLLDRRPTRLSGGQSQRVALARAMVRTPDLFLFDEPLSSLDAQIRSQARGELRELHDRTRITTLYVTHDQTEALGLADRIMVMEKGIVHQIGTPQQLYYDPADTFVAGFIGDPPMNLLQLENAIIGVRPEHFHLASEAPGKEIALELEIEVEHLEFLGAEWLIYGVVRRGLPQQHQQPRVIGRLRQAAMPTIGTRETHHFVVTKEDACFFDSNTGSRLSEAKVAIA
ncbi:ABC transporter ATP-binding protein [Litchfieldella qijiaojingensis]|uniref:ABC transporter ATP-binding protein n=1 Tax=Litchfieldella qijiaojingensis TaxID=980347 RepID=A0ABQ2YYX7_9GAMM|nr:ABC transporter ATP-binding protein [Halomonas qijiaojingensis]GGX96608.1 ABC transporter ATP-binding protein [Halomonas qijiaojingensis]